MQRTVNPPSSDIGGSIPSRPTGNTRQQAAIGIGHAIAHYAARGCAVFVPVADISRYDLLIDTGVRILRVEVKTTRQADGEVDLRTKGGNSSWGGEVKRVSAHDCDVVFAVNLVTGAECEFLVEEVDGRCSISV
jgi:hypothetical protein